MEKHQTDAYPLDPSLNPRNFLPPSLKKVDVLNWEGPLKRALLGWLRDSESPFQAVCAELRGSLAECNLEQYSEDEILDSSLPLFADLHQCGALPALVFNYDRENCEEVVRRVLGRLTLTEAEWKRKSPEWKKKMAEFNIWERQQGKSKVKDVKTAKGKKKADMDDEVASKLDAARESASRETSKWESFDPDEPVRRFSFADNTKLSKEEMADEVKKLSDAGISGYLIRALQRGLGVHHAGMNRVYRQV